MTTDYYELLGVSRSATADEIKKAYRREARIHHPDANPGNDDSDAVFKQLSQAYEVLSDPDKRARYDRFGPEGVSGGGDPFAGGVGRRPREGRTQGAAAVPLREGMDPPAPRPSNAGSISV